MSNSVHAPPIIGHQRIVESMPPPRWFAPDQAIIALIVLFALFLFGLAGVTLSEQPEKVWYWGVPAVVLGSGAFCLVIAMLYLLGLRQRGLRQRATHSARREAWGRAGAQRAGALEN